MFCNSMLAVSNNVFIFFPVKNKLVSSANIMGSYKFEVYCRSFTYIKNKRGPNIDHCGTPHTTSFKSVFLILLI